jgi:DNA-binding protein HU-alpha
MNKKQLIDFIAEQAEVTQKVAEATLKATFDGITQAMVDGEGIQIPGFGGFSSKARAARTGRNPRTGEALQIAAANVPAFKAGTQLKETVNNAKEKETV